MIQEMVPITTPPPPLLDDPHYHTLPLSTLPPPPPSWMIHITTHSLCLHYHPPPLLKHCRRGINKGNSRPVGILVLTLVSTGSHHHHHHHHYRTFFKTLVNAFLYSLGSQAHRMGLINITTGILTIQEIPLLKIKSFIILPKNMG